MDGVERTELEIEHEERPAGIVCTAKQKNNQRAKVNFETTPLSVLVSGAENRNNTFELEREK